MHDLQAWCCVETVPHHPVCWSKLAEGKHAAHTTPDNGHSRQGCAKLLLLPLLMQLLQLGLPHHVFDIALCRKRHLQVAFRGCNAALSTPGSLVSVGTSSL